MSKRFGRNRRRKLEARIKSLEEAYQRENGLLTHVQRERHRCAEQLQTLILEFKGWWDKCVLIKPEIVNHNGRHLPPYYRVSTRKALGLSLHVNTPKTIEMEVFYQTLEAVRIAAHASIDDRHSHVLLSVGDKQVGYYIDPRVFKTLGGMPNEMRRYVADVLCAELDKIAGRTMA